MDAVTAYYLGRVRYAEALGLQEQLLAARLSSAIGNTLLLLEHEPVITGGRGASIANVLMSDAELRAHHIDFHETGRGGDMTYHGPGQLVGYPIVDLSPGRCDVRRYVRDLAQIMMDLSASVGVQAGVLPGDPKLIGVWTDTERPGKWDAALAEQWAQKSAAPPPSLAKVGAIGVRLSRWVTMHGFALNVSTDLAGFSAIVPCGIKQFGVTRLWDLSPERPTVRDMADRAIDAFGRVFETTVAFADADSLRRQLAAVAGA